MRTTVDLSDDLYRRVKAEASLRGRKVKDLVEEALRYLLASAELNKAEMPTVQPSPQDSMRDCGGCVTGAPADYATNPESMEGLGR